MVHVPIGSPAQTNEYSLPHRTDLFQRDRIPKHQTGHAVFAISKSISLFTTLQKKKVKRKNSRGRVPVPRQLRLLSIPPQLGNLVPAQLDLERTRIVLEVFERRRARDGNDVVALGGHPREAHLGRGSPMAARDLADAVDEGHDAREVVAAELGHAAAPVVGRQVVERLDGAREQAAPDGAVGDDGDAQLAARLEDARPVRLDVQEERAVLDLVRGDGVHRVGAPDRGRRALGQPEVANLALPASR